MYVGIDISKDSFSVATPIEQGAKKHEVKNFPYKTQENIQNFIATLSKDAHCVMEATGVYHKRLAYALVQSGRPVSVINPCSIKYFVRMKGIITKTDSADARAIQLYAQEQKPILYEKPTEQKDMLDQRRSVLSIFEKQLQMLKNMKESLNHQPFLDDFSSAIVDDQICTLEAQINLIKQKIKDLTNDHFSAQYNALLTVPCIGKETALAFIEAFNSFQGKGSTNPSKAFCKYVGLVPVIHESGKSVKRSEHIARSACPPFRQKLYLAVLSSIYNAKADHPAKTIFFRLRQKGKAFKEALIAAMHKIVRIAFSICLNGGTFDPNFDLAK